MKQFRNADFGLRIEGRNYSEAWKHARRTKREAVAVRGMFWSLAALLVGSLLVIFAGGF